MDRVEQADLREQHVPALQHVRAGEARAAAETARVLREADEREPCDCGEDGEGEEVLQEAEDVRLERPRPEERDVEVGVEGLADGLERLRLQDDEAPEDQGVQDAVGGPAQDLLLSQDMRDLVLGLLAPVAHPARHRLCHAEQAHEHHRPPAAETRRRPGR